MLIKPIEKSTISDGSQAGASREPDQATSNNYKTPAKCTTKARELGREQPRQLKTGPGQEPDGNHTGATFNLHDESQSKDTNQIIRVSLQRWEC